MAGLEADADLRCLCAVGLPLPHDQETGGVLLLGIHAPLQHLQPVELGSLLAGKRRCCPVAALRHLLGRQRRIQHWHRLDFRMRLKEGAALTDGLGMGIHPANLSGHGSADAQERMPDQKIRLSHNGTVRVTEQQVEIVRHRPMGGILNGQHRIVCLSLVHRLHGIVPGLDIIENRVRRKALPRGDMGISALHALVNHALTDEVHGRNLFKAQVHAPSALLQNFQLPPPGEGHELCIELPHALFIKIGMHKGSHRVQLLLFPRRVQHLLAGADLVPGHLLTKGHSLLIEGRYLAVHNVQLIS